MGKREELEKLHAKWKTECACELRATSLQAVPGDGSAEAEIVFIGEAPGQKEDEQGRPFVGAAGKFLAEMLSSINLKREGVYITNIVKYRPPNNRDPLPEEKNACREWLLGELKKISQAHGKLLIKKFGGMPTKYFYALYHPAAALYDGSMREVLMTDFKKIPKVLEKIKNNIFAGTDFLKLKKS